MIHVLAYIQCIKVFANDVISTEVKETHKYLVQDQGFLEGKNGNFVII